MWKIPLFKIYWDEEDVRMVSDAIKAGMNWATGPNVGKFEELIASYVGTKYAVTFNSGTSALHAALLAHGIKNGDEVIVYIHRDSKRSFICWSETGLCRYRRRNFWLRP